MSFLPGLAELLEYDRRAVANGRIWRLLTGQLVHWSPRMTLVDLGVLLVLGVWLERCSRRILVATLISAGGLIAAGMHFLARDIVVYRGSSGLATATFSAVALVILLDRHRDWWWRVLGGLALLMLGAKTLWEMRHGTALAAGALPPGVHVVPFAHAIGGIAGLAAAAVFAAHSSRSNWRDRW